MWEIKKSIEKLFPGSEIGLWLHLQGQETEPFCLSVFVPLVSVSREMGATEFLPGSHVYSRPIHEEHRHACASTASCGSDASSSNPISEPVAIETRLGDVVVFDHRVVHRGLRNEQRRDRPVLYATFSRPWFRDHVNFEWQGYPRLTS